MSETNQGAETRASKDTLIFVKSKSIRRGTQKGRTKVDLRFSQKKNKKQILAEMAKKLKAELSYKFTIAMTLHSYL